MIGGGPKALSPRAEGEHWVARWVDASGEERDAGLHPSAEQAEAVAAALAAAADDAERANRARGAYKSFPRVLKPVGRPAGKPVEWQGRYYDHAGRDRRAGGWERSVFRARSHAEAAIEDHREGGANGGDAAASALPLSGYVVDNWPPGVMEETARTNAERVRVFARALGRDPRIDLLTVADVHEAKHKLIARGYAPSYIKQVLSAVRGLLTVLQSHEVVRRNVANHVSLSPSEVDAALENHKERSEELVTAPTGRAREIRRFAERHAPRALSQEEFTNSLPFFDPYWSPRIELVLATGCRPSELGPLNRQTYDRDTQTIRVVDNVSRRGRPQVGTKTTHHDANRQEGRVTLAPRHIVAAIDATGIDLKGRLFQPPRGGPLHPANFRNRVITPAVKAAVAAGVCDPWNLKDLRHTFATVLREADLPITDIAHWMGDSVRIEGEDGQRRRLRSQVVSTYVHPTDAHVARAVEVILRFVGRTEWRLFEAQ